MRPLGKGRFGVIGESCKPDRRDEAAFGDGENERDEEGESE
jgi:hypothetical protein